LRGGGNGCGISWIRDLSDAQKSSKNVARKHPMCCNLSLGLATKARACKVAGQERSRGSHLMLPGVQESVRE
jgi:hypothetical protein